MKKFIEKNKRLICVFMVIILSVSLVSGCDETSQKKKQEKSKGTKTEEVKKGRYMERNVSFPKTVKSDSVINVVEGKDKKFELFSQNKKDGIYEHFIKTKDGWKKDPLKWLANDKLYKKDKIFVEQFLFGEDETYYVKVFDSTRQTANCRIYRVNDKNLTLEELQLDYLENPFKTNQDGNKVYPFIENIQVLEDGTLVLNDLASNSLILADSKDGKKIGEINIQDEQNGASYEVVGNQIIAVNKEKNKVVFYNDKNGKIEKQIEIDKAVKQSHFYKKKDGTLLLVNGNGIQQLNTNGSLWETIVDGELNSMNIPNLSINNIYVLEDEKDKDSYLVTYQDKETNTQLKMYQFDSSVPAVPSKEITVYSLQENNTIRQAISVFHRNNSDVKVKYIVSMSGEDGGKKADYIRALNTELLNGNGADILVLDGLPVDSYVEKGILLDSKEFYKDLAKKTNIPDYILKSYEKDNKIVSLPSRFTIPIVYGEEQAVKAWNSVERILEYGEKHKDKLYMDGITSEQILNIFFEREQEHLFSKEQQLNATKLSDFLEKIKQLAEQLNAKETDKNKERYQATKGVTKLYFNLGASYLDGLSETSLEQIGSVEDSMIFLAMIKEKKQTYEIANNCFIPSGTIGINKASKESDISKRFLTTLFSDEVQKINMNDGFPVNEEILKSWFERDTYPFTMALSSTNGEPISIDWPNKKERDGLYQKIVNVSNQFWVDDTLNDIIVSEALNYLNGTNSLLQVTNSIKAKVDTYLSE